MSSKVQQFAIVLALSLSLPFVAGCSEKPTTGTDTQESETAVQEQKEPEAEETKDEAATTDTAAPATSGQRVGAEGTGFVTVPDNWIEFHDTDGNTSIQWCDGTPFTVISLNTFDTTGVPEDQLADFDAEAAANSVWQSILDSGADEDAIQGARVQLAGRDAVQVYTIFPDGGYLVCWLAEDDNGVIRYVAAEGTEDTTMDSVNIVQDTYEF